MKEETYICAICGRKYPISQREEFDGQSLCPHCFTEETVACHVCGERVWTDDNAGNSDTPLCEHCYDRYYINCVRCGELLHNDEAYYDRNDPDEEEPLCHACYARTAGDQPIQDYCYKPEPVFYGDGPRFFGVELEIQAHFCGSHGAGPVFAAVADGKVEPGAVGEVGLAMAAFLCAPGWGGRLAGDE